MFTSQQLYLACKVDAISVFPAIVALAIALITCFLIARTFGVETYQDRFASIDGLRGYLAFFVFLSHSCIWYFYLRSDEWRQAPSNLYNHFGESSVVLFFMISGFLFFSKLIEGRTKGIDWGRLFVSRFLRLAPLYFLLMFSFFLIAAHLSNYVLIDSFSSLIKDIFKWLSFRIFGAPVINGVQQINTTIVGITWSLPYEWFFYLSLPLLALTVSIVPPKKYILLGVIGVIGCVIWQPSIRLLLPFLGGIAAACLVRFDGFRQYAVTSAASIVIVSCICAAVIYFPSGYHAASLILFTVAFILIASGNSLFGLLTNSISRTLGELAYGIYLLHSITLFVVFNFIIGLPLARTFSPLEHWIVILGVTPFLILICFFVFRTIERPAMRSTTKVMNWLRSLIHPKC